MPYPISVKKNDYHKNPKCSTVYTPVEIAQFLFDILSPVVSKPGMRLDNCSVQLNGHVLGGASVEWCVPTVVFDPAIGTGRLTDPWFTAGAKVYGCDIKDQGGKCHEFTECRFEDYTLDSTPDLVLCNSPFNGCSGRQLYPEVFLRRIFDLFGPKVPTVLVTPMGFRLNQKKKSKRWQWLRGCGAEITSIVSLPTDAFPGVAFHCEILIFNVPKLKPHYFLP